MTVAKGVCALREKSLIVDALSHLLRFSNISLVKSRLQRVGSLKAFALDEIFRTHATTRIRPTSSLYVT